MPEWLYPAGPYGLWLFLSVTVVLGGLAAFVSGRAIAQTWRPFWQVAVYMLPLAAGVRFIHFSIFGETLLSLRCFVVDYLALLALAIAGYRSMRAGQMQAQYGWMAPDGTSPRT